MTKIEEIQKILGVNADGAWGPLSDRALKAEIRRSLEAKKPPVTSTVLDGNHPFVVVAREWIGKAETSRNRFEGDKMLWADTNYPTGYQDRAPYCAAFQCFIVAEAGRRGANVKSRPTSASVREFRNWARERGFLAKSPQPGDQFTLLPSGTSHIGLVEKVAGDLIHTLEGNTDGEGSREGDGFYRKVRRISKCDFIRIPV